MTNPMKLITFHVIYSGEEITRAAKIFVPVRSVGLDVLDNGGDVIALCATPQVAGLIQHLINKNAGTL